jgi:hypothetical protein
LPVKPSFGSTRPLRSFLVCTGRAPTCCTLSISAFLRRAACLAEATRFMPLADDGPR